MTSKLGSFMQNDPIIKKSDICISSPKLPAQKEILSFQFVLCYPVKDLQLNNKRRGIIKLLLSVYTWDCYESRPVASLVCLLEIKPLWSLSYLTAIRWWNRINETTLGIYIKKYFS